jgi:hypothetical protein
MTKGQAMPDLTHQPQAAEAPSSPLTEPSYAAQVLETMADELIRVGKSRIVTEVMLRRAHRVAVAARLHALPTPVADEAAAKAWAAIPADAAGNTHAEQAALLRTVARTV